MRKTLLAFALIVAFSVVGAQESSDEWFWGKSIGSVQWDGVKKANRNELDALLRNYVGKPFTPDLWLEMQSRLYELEWFDSIEPLAVPVNDSKEQLILRFVVKEKPSVLSVRVSGNSGVRASDILAAIGIKSGDIYNATKASLDDVAVKKLYNEKGYPDAVVAHEVTPSADPSLLVLTYTMVEGAQVSLRTIKFTGNTSMSAQTLKGQMTLKEAALFQSGAFQETKLEESKKAVIDYYQSKGFVDAKIIDVFKEYEKDETSGKNWLILTLALSEGRQWKYGGMAFEGNNVFSGDKLKDLVTLKQGSILNYKKLQLEKQKIDDLYYESGYIFNQINLKEERDENSGSILFTITVTERDRAHIETLSFKGNEKTKEFVLAREMPLEAGDIFSKAKIIDGMRNLYNLQYFSTVEPEIHQGSAANLMDLVLNVEEMSTADVQFGVTLSGLGSSDSFPLSGYVKWNDRNLGGKGQNLQANVTLSPTEQSLETSFSENWLFNKRISRGLSLKFEHSTETTGQDILGPVFTDQDIPDPYVAIGSGTNEWSGSLSSIPDQYLMPYENWDFSLGFNLGYTLKTRVGDLGATGGLSSGLGMINYDEDKYRPYEAEFRDTNQEWLLTNKIYGRAYLNNLDYWYNPAQGYYASQRLTVTGFLPFERQHYIKSETRLDGYATLFTIPITETWKFKWVLMAHSGFQALFAEPWADFRVTKDWVSLDGTFNVRGWDDLYGSKGTMLWENSLELRMPVIDQMLWMDLFVDAGAMKTRNGMVDMSLSTPAADTTQPSFADISWKNFAFSTGLGFRFTIPQFPFRFYFAKRFTFDGSDISWKTTGTDFDFVLSITQPLY
ncbi:MAG TPA: outer membrane protein assembly factor BamA [Rectinemataceae bacterium]|nr:outer membrane protein assembly factor BamA [Rectinemataceae bacterium]